MKLQEIQEQLRAQRLDGWLFYDHHHRDPIAYRVLGLPENSHVSRRWYYWLPASGDPVRLVHRIEGFVLDSLPGAKKVYSSWSEQHEQLRSILDGSSHVAMQHSPDCMIPYVALVDAGTVDLVRSFDIEVVSSAALVQHFEARWTAEQYEQHREAGRRVDRVRREAFELIGQRIASSGESAEIEIAEFIRQRFAEEGLSAEDGPIVGVNAHSGNPHYTPTPESSTPIRRGDWVLIDLWAKLEQPRSVYYDVTWTGFVGEQVPEKIQEVFEVVTGARDRALARINESLSAGDEIAGYQVDDAVRQFITERGYGDSFTHRTGHSIGEEVHGNGANMDNLETRDERLLIPRTCFSIEPGVYLPDFGVRSEIDCYISEDGATATGEVQREIVRIA